jgi:hypothetical protein
VESMVADPSDQNCASVEITGGGSGLTGPAPFVANANVNECATIENIDVVFPNPGSSVKYGGSYASTRPTAPAGFSGSNCVGPGDSSNGSSAPAPVESSSAPETPSAASTSVESAAVSSAAGPATTLVTGNLHANVSCSISSRFCFDTVYRARPKPASSASVRSPTSVRLLNSTLLTSDSSAVAACTRLLIPGTPSWSHCLQAQAACFVAGRRVLYNYASQTHVVNLCITLFLHVEDT